MPTIYSADALQENMGTKKEGIKPSFSKTLVQSSQKVAPNRMRISAPAEEPKSFEPPT
jgi:hypothetical protein